MDQAAGSVYLQWSKTRRAVTYSLAASGVMPCEPSDLGISIRDIEINNAEMNGFHPLIEAIGNHHKVPAECVVPASGTSMANFLVMAALLHSGDEAIIEEPVYEPLLSIARYLGAAIKRFSRTTNGETGLTAQMFTNRSRLVVLTNLHNPTCTELKPSEIQRIAELAEQAGARVLIDEVYLECKYENAISAFRTDRRLICTGSLTKAYGLGGLRCGWILAEPDIVRRLRSLKDLIDPSANHTGEKLGTLAFHNLDRLAKRAKAIVDQNRARLAEYLLSTPELELTIPKFGSCLFPRLVSGNVDSLFQRLQEQYDTDFVPGRFFERPDHFRVGLGVSPEVFSEGLCRLSAAL